MYLCECGAMLQGRGPEPGEYVCDFCGLRYPTCKICGQPTCYGNSRLCDGCFESEKRLDELLATDKGVFLVLEKLKDKGFRVVKAYN